MLKKRHLPFVSALLMSSSLCTSFRPRRYHQEIEDFICSLVQKYEEQKKSEQEKSHLNAKPQVL